LFRSKRQEAWGKLLGVKAYGAKLGAKIHSVKAKPPPRRHPRHQLRMDLSTRMAGAEMCPFLELVPPKAYL